MSTASSSLHFLPSGSPPKRCPKTSSLSEKPLSLPYFFTLRRTTSSSTSWHFLLPGSSPKCFRKTSLSPYKVDTSESSFTRGGSTSALAWQCNDVVKATPLSFPFVSQNKEWNETNQMERLSYSPKLKRYTQCRVPFFWRSQLRPNFWIFEIFARFLTFFHISI